MKFRMEEIMNQNTSTKKTGHWNALPDNLKGTKTEKNLMAAFIGESQARNKYTYFAGVAKKEGYEQIGAIFTETADNEKEHAELWLEALGGINDTNKNLNDAMDGEGYEYLEMYPTFAKEAKEEGFTEIARKFEMVAEIEKRHHDRYRKLLENLMKDEVFRKKTGMHLWKCRNCGNVVVSKEAPKICPVCNKPQAYFELNCDNF